MRFLPRWLWIPATVATVFLGLPLLAVALRLPWSNIPQILSTPAATEAIQLSVFTCLISTALSVLLGVPLALIFGRYGEQGRLPAWLATVRAVVTVPLVMPPVVAGIALLTAFGRSGILGPSLSAFGVTVPFTTVAVIFAQTFVSMPFLIITVETAVKTLGCDFERAASHLGASRWRQFSRITIPLLTPSLLSGAALAAARSLGEFGATITFAGSMQGTTRTLPLEVYLQREVDTDTALALSMVLIVFALILTLLTTLIETYNAKRFAPQSTILNSPHDRVDTSSKLLPRHPYHSDAGTGYTPWSIRALVPSRGVDIRLKSKTSEVIALIGPNGAGKSTTAQYLAGDLLRAPNRSGKSDSAERSDNFPKRISFLHQKPALFPHMTVLENVAFGPRCQGLASSKALEIARHELAAVSMEEFAKRPPHQLSGGQAQRVALARALAVNPQLLVLDEPFSGLDHRAQSGLRSIIQERTRRGLGVVLITHELLDVISLADRVAVLEDGHLKATGTVSEILDNPPTSFVADFLGVNMLVGIFDDAGVRLTSGLHVAGILSEETKLIDGDSAAAICEPAAVALRKTTSEGSPRNAWQGHVSQIQSQHTNFVVTVEIAPQTYIKSLITASAMTQLALSIGDAVIAEVKATQVKITARG
ncbi:ABC transporter permease [Arcanobacterium ihumii]|uniref:ABC transporter permease n=1 Tax=Arcanobacterium ihumii TaxID=2138162 RepID=UPI000F52A850|nr:ABC transporter permease [Arcanobacterium ihumii]